MNIGNNNAHANGNDYGNGNGNDYGNGNGNGTKGYGADDFKDVES